MALLHVNYFSEALGVQTPVDVILPEGKQGIGVEASGECELPKVLYLLHGYSDDHTIWQRRTSVERYAARHNLAVVMPGVNHSFYCNEFHGERYWDFVSQELPAVMHRFFRLSDKPEDTFVAGLSMGGYGAMKLALNFPERFGAGLPSPARWTLPPCTNDILRSGSASSAPRPSAARTATCTICSRSTVRRKRNPACTSPAARRISSTTSTRSSSPP